MIAHLWVAYSRRCLTCGAHKASRAARQECRPPKRRDLKCECGNEWTEVLKPSDPNPACAVCSSKVVVRV